MTLAGGEEQKLKKQVSYRRRRGARRGGRVTGPSQSDEAEDEAISGDEGQLGSRSVYCLLTGGVGPTRGCSGSWRTARKRVAYRRPQKGLAKGLLV